MKKTMIGHSPGLPAVMLLMTSAFAPKTAGSNSVLMDSGTELKNVLPIVEPEPPTSQHAFTARPSVSCRKMMAKA